MKSFVEEFIAEMRKEDIDLTYPFYDEYANPDMDMHPSIDYSDKVNWQDAPSMDLDEVIQILQSLKEKGANRVYLYAHCDHHGYIFTGINLKEK